jgi:hypothetical protein
MFCTIDPAISEFCIQILYPNNRITHFQPPGEPPGIAPVGLPGGLLFALLTLSNLRASSPRFDPGDLPCLTEAVRSANSFSGVKTARKPDRLAQTPDRQANVAASLHMVGSS